MVFLRNTNPYPRKHWIGWLGGMFVCAVLLAVCHFRPTNQTNADVPSQIEPAVESTSLMQSIAHDFGVVLTNDRVEHTYVIQNTDMVPWTFKGLSRTCSRVDAKISKNPIPAGEAAEVIVVQRAPSKRSDVIQRVVLSFKEASSPLIALECKVSARNPLEVMPESFSLPIGRGEVFVTATLSVEAYTAAITTIGIQSDSDWLVSASPQIEPQAAVASTEADDRRSPQRRWRVDLRIQGAKLPKAAMSIGLVISPS